MTPTHALNAIVGRSLIVVVSALCALPSGARAQRWDAIRPQWARTDTVQPTRLCVTPLLLGASDPLASFSQPLVPVSRTAYQVTPEGEVCRIVEVEQEPQMNGPVPTSPARAALYSALLPGMGQRSLGQARWPVYLGVEAWAWIQFFDERSEGNALQDDYRDLAWSVARRVSSGRRVDGDFEYYESLTKYTESGAWDAHPERPGIQPETDPETFNGTVWGLAREIFFPPDVDGPVSEDSPAFQHALEYYMDRGVTPGFAWSWRDNELQQSVYGDIIQQSDETLRNSTTMAGVIIANHVVSAVDALISARLRLPDPDALTIQVIPFPDRGRDWGLIVRFTP